MTRYREILRLSSLGFSNRNIALSVPCSRNTVAKVLKRAQELDISWPLEDNQTDEVLEGLFYPKQSDRSQKRMPDYDYIHKELLRNGVSKKLLWTEYMEDCRANGDEPLMYSQFCYHIQQDEQKRRATMHINRKPGEQVEVDWAGDPATIIDPDTGEIGLHIRWCNDIQPVCICGSLSGYEAEIMDHSPCPYVRVFWRCCQNSRTG